MSKKLQSASCAADERAVFLHSESLRDKPKSLLEGQQLVSQLDREEDAQLQADSWTQSEDLNLTRSCVGAEKVKTELVCQVVELDDRIRSLDSLLEQQHLTLDEQEEVFENIRTDHEKLRRWYLQAKEDYNVLRRSGLSLKDANFDQERELEGRLFHLGMKFDELHAKVDTNLKEKLRQPFQCKHNTDSNEVGESDAESSQVIDNLKHKMQETLAGSDVVPLKEDLELEHKLQRLHEEYNALMDRYRRLKQMAQTPEKDKEIDNLVRKLKHICDEAPDMFRLAPELEESNCDKTMDVMIQLIREIEKRSDNFGLIEK